MSINYPLHYLKELAIARSQLAQLQSNLDNEQETEIVERCQNLILKKSSRTQKKT